jgi:hypothetical protein
MAYVRVCLFITNKQLLREANDCLVWCLPSAVARGLNAVQCGVRHDCLAAVPVGWMRADWLGLPYGDQFCSARACLNYEYFDRTERWLTVIRALFQCGVNSIRFTHTCVQEIVLDSCTHYKTAVCRLAAWKCCSSLTVRFTLSLQVPGDSAGNSAETESHSITK